MRIDKINTVICGNAREKLKELPAGSVNCIITSPPYWALRDYGIEPMIWDDGWTGCLGLEPTIELYLKHLVGIFDGAKRVLRDDGTCFVNLGDTYNNAAPGARDAGRWPKQSRNDHTPNQRPPADVKIKSLCLIPFRFAIAMVDRGWILRNTLIWSKPNPMPSSAKDRFTVDFEYIFFFVKKKKYWFEPQYEPYEQCSVDRMGYGLNTLSMKPSGERPNTDEKVTPNPLGRNKRTTWTIPTEPFPEAHFATFPCALVEPMIKAGCPEFVCKKCGKARVKIIEVTGGTIGQDWNQHNIEHPNGRDPNKTQKVISAASNGTYKKEFKGYTSCSCDVGYEPGIVIDFFSGSGTVGKVAAYLRRNYILIDAKKEYCKMAKERIAEPETGVPVAEQRQGQKSLFEREGK